MNKVAHVCLKLLLLTGGRNCTLERKVHVSSCPCFIFSVLEMKEVEARGLFLVLAVGSLADPGSLGFLCGVT